MSTLDVLFALSMALVVTMALRDLLRALAETRQDASDREECP